jgi:hypothetical protein
MKRTLLLSLGAIGVLVGAGFILPAVALWRHDGSLASSNATLLALGVGLSLTGIGAAWRGLHASQS